MEGIVDPKCRHRWAGKRSKRIAQRRNASLLEMGGETTR
jgi:hypothetical protein